MSSKLIGTKVYSDANKDIGVIKDIALAPNGVSAYIINLGSGHDIAVRPSAVKLSYDDLAKKWDAKMNATADQLKTAPEYQSPNGTAG